MKTNIQYFDGEEYINKTREEKQDRLLFNLIQWLKFSLKLGYDILNKNKEFYNKSFEKLFDENNNSFFKQKVELSPEFVNIANKVNKLILNTKPKANYYDPYLVEAYLNIYEFGYHNLYLWVLATNQVKEFIKRFNYLSSSEYKIAKTIFDKATLKLSEVRDIFEHNYEYINGGGKNKEKNFVIDKELSHVSSATSVMLTG